MRINLLVLFHNNNNNNKKKKTDVSRQNAPVLSHQLQILLPETLELVNIYFIIIVVSVHPGSSSMDPTLI